jgi:acyl-CoA synthetase (AMP-forming)/AMP-acid ligase II
LIKFDKSLCDYKIIDSRLFVKTETAMLGYLTGESPNFVDGWLDTGDLVIEEDGWLKILGRESDLINVGGQKVFPAEVESVVMEMDNIVEAVVYPVPNPVFGNVIGLKVQILIDESIDELKKKIRIYCNSRLENYKIPVYIEKVDKIDIDPRFKKLRK